VNQTRRKKTIEIIARERVSAIIRTSDQATARDAIQAAVDGGFRIVEFTFTTPGALELVAEFSRKDGLLVGAGTVMSPELVRDAVAAGARFVVSPICDPRVVAEAAEQDVACIPGAFTPTEMETAYRLGADFVKVFPAPPGGVAYIEAVRGPLPHLRLFPTAGATPENFTEYLDAGCAGVGFVKSLFDPADLASRRFDAIRERAQGIVRRLAAWCGMDVTP
jgi:Entner-Doudoroff aldolase